MVLRGIAWYCSSVSDGFDATYSYKKNKIPQYVHKLVFIPPPPHTVYVYVCV